MIAFDDTELSGRSMQVIEEGSGQFLPALAEAAVIACAEDYFLVRPVLINLKHKYCVGSPAPGETKQMMSGRAARDSNSQSSAATTRRNRGKSGFRDKRSEVIIMKWPKGKPRRGSRMLSVLAFSCLVLASTSATPQVAPKPQEKTKAELEQLIYSVKGPELFRAHCAACHGPDAKGGGPMAQVLKTKVPDLTVLAKKNGGQFPSAQVRHAIMGDDVAMSHGSREMPIWGPIFHQIESDQDFGNVRLQNLLQYLESIQVK